MMSQEHSRASTARRWVLLAAAALAGVALFAPPAGAAEHPANHAKLDGAIGRVVDGANGTASVRTVIQAQPGRGQAILQAARERGIPAQQVGGNPDLLAVRASRDELLSLAANPDTQRVSSDAVVRAHATAAADTTIRAIWRQPRPPERSGTA
jgi:hypothetical protein